MQALEVEGWLDTVENLDVPEFRKAWAEYQRSGPRTKAGKLYKPDAGALYLIAMDARPKVRIVPDPAPVEVVREPMSPERRQAIMDDVGFHGDIQVHKFTDKPKEIER